MTTCGSVLTQCSLSLWGGKWAHAFSGKQHVCLSQSWDPVTFTHTGYGTIDWNRHLKNATRVNWNVNLRKVASRSWQFRGLQLCFVLYHQRKWLLCFNAHLTRGFFFHFIWQERPKILYSTPTSTVSFNNNNNNNCFTVNAEQSGNSSQETHLTLILKRILSVDINVKNNIKTVAQRATFEIFRQSERTRNNPNSSPVPIDVCQRTTSTCLCNK